MASTSPMHLTYIELATFLILFSNSSICKYDHAYKQNARKLHALSEDKPSCINCTIPTIKLISSRRLHRRTQFMESQRRFFHELSGDGQRFHDFYGGYPATKIFVKRILKPITVPQPLYMPQIVRIAKKVPVFNRVPVIQNIQRPIIVHKIVPIHKTMPTHKQVTIPVPVKIHAPYSVKKLISLPKPFVVRIARPLVIHKPFRVPFPVKVPKHIVIPVHKHFPLSIRKPVPFVVPILRVVRVPVKKQVPVFFDGHSRNVDLFDSSAGELSTLDSIKLNEDDEDIFANGNAGTEHAINEIVNYPEEITHSDLTTEDAFRRKWDQ